MSFPLAMTLFLSLMTGIELLAWGVIISRAWLTVLGLVISFLSCWLYWASLPKESS